MDRATLLGVNVFPWQYKKLETLLEQCLYCQSKALPPSNVVLPTAIAITLYLISHKYFKNTSPLHISAYTTQSKLTTLYIAGAQFSSKPEALWTALFVASLLFSCLWLFNQRQMASPKKTVSSRVEQKTLPVVIAGPQSTSQLFQAEVIH